MFWCKLGAFFCFVFCLKRQGCWNALIPCNDDIETLVTSETVLKRILTRYFKSDKCIHIYVQSVLEFFTDLKFKNIGIHLEKNSSSFFSQFFIFPFFFFFFKCTLLHTINWCWICIISVIFYYKLPQVFASSMLESGWVPCQFLSGNRLNTFHFITMRACTNRITDSKQTEFIRRLIWLFSHWLSEDHSGCVFV